MDLDWLFFCSIEKQGFRLYRLHHPRQDSKSNYQPTWYVFSLLSCFLMVEIEDLESRNLEFLEVEGYLVHKYSEVSDTIILNDSIEAAQSRLKTLQLHGIDTHRVFNYFLFYFFVEQTPSYPKFIDWCLSNYSPSKGVIMDVSRYRMMCLINSLTI